MADIKGAAMKVGQSISVLADSLDVPKEISTILSTLNDRYINPFEEIEAVLYDEFQNRGVPFLSIDPIPLEQHPLHRRMRQHYIMGNKLLLSFT